jgi:ABC-type uncharacterized transport system involved in gliding motility auxiliary subunit
MKMTAVKLKNLKYLLWIGPVLMVMGLTAGAVAGSWGVVPLGLILIGLAVVMAWLFLEGSAIKGFLGRRSTQAGTNALIATIAVFVILGLLNFLAVRYVTRVDLTENQLFTLAPQSQEVVQKLQQPIKVWIFDITPNPQDKALLENYRRQSKNFSYEYVDPQSQPGVARDFGVRTVGEVYVEAGKERRFLQAISAEERLSERRLTNGMAQVSSDRQSKIYFLQGHGERQLQAGQGGLSQLVSRMGEENYLTEPLNLLEAQKVPDDASAVVIAGPQRSLLPSELTALQDYQKKRSGVMLMVDPQTNPELEGFLNPWGVKFSDRIIIDPAGQAIKLGAAVTVITQYGSQSITRDFGNGISFYPVSRPLEIKSVEGVKTEPLLTTNDRTQAQQLKEDGHLQFDPATDPQGSFTLGVALSRTVKASETKPEASPSPSSSPSSGSSPSPTASPSAAASPSPSPSASPSPDEQDTPSEARMVVIGNSTFITDGLFNQQLNGDVFLNSVTWLSQQDDQVLSIRSKEATNRRIFLQPQQQILLILASLVFLPLVGFGMGIGLWWRRR